MEGEEGRRLAVGEGGLGGGEAVAGEEEGGRGCCGHGLFEDFFFLFKRDGESGGRGGMGDPGWVRWGDWMEEDGVQTFLTLFEEPYLLDLWVVQRATGKYKLAITGFGTDAVEARRILISRTTGKLVRGTIGGSVQSFVHADTCCVRALNCTKRIHNRRAKCWTGYFD